MDWAHIGAFLSGAGAVLSSIYALRSMRRRMEQRCNERVKEVTKAIHEGYHLRDEE